jgi:hypothetical protein
MIRSRTGTHPPPRSRWSPAGRGPARRPLAMVALNATTPEVPMPKKPLVKLIPSVVDVRAVGPDACRRQGPRADRPARASDGQGGTP